MHERIQITPHSAILRVKLWDEPAIPANNLSHTFISHYKESLPWYQDEYTFAGKRVKSPRMIAYMGEKNYLYSGVDHAPLPWDDQTLLIRDWAILKFKEAFPDVGHLEYNGVLFNHYRDGKDSIGSHSDSEECIDLSVPILSINLGATRTFNVLAPQQLTKIPLYDGDAILMVGRFQQELKHSVPKEPGTGERINLTFRKFF